MTHQDDDRSPPASGYHQGPVDCRALARMLGDYVDEQLPEAVKREMDSHMAMCAPCMAFLKQYRFAPDTTRKVLLNAVPPELENRVLAFLRARCAPATEE
jgi:hypothetical protein